MNRLRGWLRSCVFGSLVFVGCGGEADSPSGRTERGGLPQYQEPRCDRFGQIQLFDRYMVQNNVWNEAAAEQEQCVTALWDGSSDVAGFIVDPVQIESPDDTPASYPSLVYGWHWGAFYGPYREARTVGDIRAIATEWHFRVPDGARYDAAYDLWLHPEPSPPDSTGALEIMIWLSSEDVNPLGSLVDLVSLAGTEWEVWLGTGGEFSTVTYRRTENVFEAELELRELVVDALTRGGATEDWYLLGAQAGFEIWRASKALTTRSYRVDIQ